MTDKEILKQCSGVSKTQHYKVDAQAIRRGKANLALMMTLTTADHYDWFTGKFPSHNFFDYHGYRVYRRNVCQPAISIPVEEQHRLRTLNNELKEISERSLYPSIDRQKDIRAEILLRVQQLTPLLLDNLVKRSTQQMHYIGEICDEDDRLILDKVVDLVYIYIEANGCADVEDALARTYDDFGIGEGTFDPVPIDERTHWGMASCRIDALDHSKYYFDSASMMRISFDDHNLVLGEVVADKTTKTLTPHTRWSKEYRSRNGADLTVPFERPYPLWNLSMIQLRKDHVIMLTDNLLLATQKQQEIEDDIKEISQQEFVSEFGNYSLKQYYEFEPTYSPVLEERIKREVEARIEKKWSEKQGWKTIREELHNRLNYSELSQHDVIYYAARFLSVYKPSVSDVPLIEHYDPKQRIVFLASAIKCVESWCHAGIDWQKLYSKILDMNYLSGQDKDWYTYWNNTEYCTDMYDVLCETVDELYETDRKRWDHLHESKRLSGDFCWSSWFGGDEALPDVNWRELRKRDVVYVLTDDNKASFTTAIKVYLHTKRICKSIRFAVKKQLLSAEGMLAQAKKEYDLAPEDLQTRKQKASAFENFDPSVAPSQEVHYLLEPIISDKSITLLYAPPGVGKTWFTMCIALAVSRGQALFSNEQKSWIATTPHRIAYIDSEMTEFHFKNRLRLLDLIYRKSPSDKPFSFKLVGEESINLLDEDQNQCDKITQWLNDEAAAGNPIDLLIIDNLSTLTHFNDSAKSWDAVFSWLRALKNKTTHRCSTIVVHHSNKKGDQRGTSAKTATVDNVIKLDHQESTSPDAAVQFLVTIEKGRDIQRIPDPFTVQLCLPDKKSANPSLKAIGLNKTAKARTEEAIAYLSGNKKVPQEIIASLTGLTPAYIRQLSHQLKKKSREE